MSIEGEDVVWKFRWRIEDNETKTAHMANNKPIPVIGAAYVTLPVNNQSVESEILITPDRKKIILRINWLKNRVDSSWILTEDESGSVTETG